MTLLEYLLYIQQGSVKCTLVLCSASHDPESQAEEKSHRQATLGAALRTFKEDYEEIRQHVPELTNNTFKLRPWHELLVVPPGAFFPEQPQKEAQHHLTRPLSQLHKAANIRRMVHPEFPLFRENPTPSDYLPQES